MKKRSVMKKRSIAYWATTALVGAATLSAAFSYLTAAPEALENFRHVGYPQQLRVLLGIGKLAGAIVLLLPRLPALKEWAYAGFTFMWIAAVVAHYLAGDGAHETAEASQSEARIEVAPVRVVETLPLATLQREAPDDAYAREVRLEHLGELAQRVLVRAYA